MSRVQGVGGSGAGPGGLRLTGQAGIPTPEPANPGTPEPASVLRAQDVWRVFETGAERLEILPDFPVSTFGKVSKKALGELVARKLQDEQAAAAH